MEALIEDLLEFSRLGKSPLVRDSVDMQRLVDDVAGALQVEAAGRRVDLRRGPLEPAPGDESLLRQVWTNLLSNAFKYTRPREVAEISISCVRRPGELVYEVRDNGVGFDPRFATRLFGIFQRLHGGSEFEGTGVGLALVQRIVHRHGGRVWAEGAPGRGATFSFALPDAPGAAVSDGTTKE
jgi:light-regulated signal transduction histidine kinase (bacteriophytochrome)